MLRSEVLALEDFCSQHPIVDQLNSRQTWTRAVVMWSTGSRRTNRLITNAISMSMGQQQLTRYNGFAAIAYLTLALRVCRATAKSLCDNGLTTRLVRGPQNI